MDSLKKLLNSVIAKALFVFGWIFDGCMKILNAVNKTPIEENKDRRNVRIRQFAVSSCIFYCLCNSCMAFIVKSVHKATSSGGFVSQHFMPWDILIPISFAIFVLEIILSIVVGLGITVKLHTLYRMKNDSKNIKGDNKFMTGNDLEKNFYPVKADDISSAEKSGMLIGEKDGVYYIEPGTFNIMVVGATRSGKDQCYVLPGMRLMAYAKDKPSIIANDMKGDMLEQTYSDFVKNGYKVLVLDLVDTDRSMHWNPLQVIIDEYVRARKGSGDFSHTSKLVESFAHCITVAGSIPNSV